MAERHKLILTFDGDVSAKLICPDDGRCTKVMDECWVKTWFDNESPEDLLCGSVTVEIDVAWREEGCLEATIVEPSGAEGIADA
jgi:hypothetical protein